MVAFLNLDEVIHIIRTEDKPKEKLIKQFSISQTQAEAILEIKLRQLAKLEEIKIRDEQDALAKEREELEKTLKSATRLKTLIKKELQQDLKQYGDKRRSPIVEREEAKAIKEEDLIPSEPITVILSKKGFIRAAKGHEVDGSSLGYRSGDHFLMQACGKSKDNSLFLDSAGKSYALSARHLPSARGHGDPLTSKLKPSPGETFVGVLMGAATDLVLLASDAGYGFVTPLSQLVTKNRNGKSILKCPTAAKALAPTPIKDIQSQLLAAVTSEGRLLVFPIADLPELARGKGNKIINIPSAKAKAREELCIAVAVLFDNDALTLYSGKRHITLKPKDLNNFLGERGRRGNLLPRGFRNVDAIEVVEK